MIIGCFIFLLAFIVIFRIVVIGYFEVTCSLRVMEQETVNISVFNKDRIKKREN